MDEPTKEAIEGALMFLDNVRDGFSLLSYPADTPLTVIMDEYHRRIAVQLADVRKKARDDALETVKRCEQKSGDCVMVHSLMRHDVCNEENCSSFRALKDQPSGEA